MYFGGTTMKEKKKWDLFALSSIPLVMTLGNSMLIPVLPTMEKKLGISGFQSSMIITVYSLVAIILIPIAGYLSDRFGRKKIIIPSLIIAGIGGIISGWASWQMNDGYWIVLLGRFVQGIGAAGAFPVVIPTVGDMFEDETEVTKGLGLIETSNTFGKVLSPVLGSLLAAWIWFIPFFSIPLFSLIAIGLVFALVKVPKKEKNEKKSQTIKEFTKEIKEILSKEGKWLSAIFVIGIVSMFILFGFLFFLSNVLESKYKIEGVLKGLYLALPLLFLCATSFLTGKFIGKNRTMMKWAIVAGMLTGAGAQVPIFFTDGKWMLLTFLSLASIGVGAALPCLDALITEGIEKEHRGTITSIYSSMRFIGVAAGPPIVALLSKGTTFMILIGVSAVSAFVALWLIKPESKEAGEMSPKVT
jgi:MFS transporter, ACDE family, multidrug resistance protein